MKNLEFDPAAFEDLAWWVERDRKQALKIIKISLLMSGLAIITISISPYVTIRATKFHYLSTFLNQLEGLRSFQL